MLANGKIAEFINYPSYGLNIFPCRNKRPLGAWESYQEKMATGETVAKWFGNDSNYNAFGIICGKISGSLYCFDFDNHLGNANQIFSNWRALINSCFAGLAEKTVIEKSINGGFHVYFRCPTIAELPKEERPGNKKLASMKAPDGRMEAIIETRGEGGFVVCSPTDGYTLQRGSFDQIASISKEQFDAIIELSKTFDERMKNEEAREFRSQNAELREVRELRSKNEECRSKNEEVRAGDDAFESYKDADVHGELLQQLGWQYLYTQEGIEYWKRPGKRETTVGGTWGATKSKRSFDCFSSNAEPMENGQSYSNIDLRMFVEGLNPKKKEDLRKAGKMLRSEGYGKPTTDYKKKETHTPTKRIQQEETDATADPEEFNAIEGDFWLHRPNPKLTFGGDMFDNELIFWTVTKTPTEKGGPVLSFEPDRYLNLLRFLGFCQYKNGKDNYNLIRIKDNIVYESDTGDIQRTLKELISSKKFPENINSEEQAISKRRLLKLLADKPKRLCDKDFLLGLETIDLYDDTQENEYFPNHTLLRDTETTAYRPYKNTILKITKEKIELIKYKDAPGLVRAEAIIQRNYRDLLNNDFSLFKNCVFRRFLANVCRSYPKEGGDKRVLNKDKFAALQTAIAYLMHGYKDQRITKAVILTEEKIGDDADDANGRTGKSLILLAIAQFIPTCKIDGKKFSKDDDFAWDNYKVGDMLIAIDDIIKNFDFETLFSLLTGALVVNPKHKARFVVPFEFSPKILITGNYPIKNNSASALDRMFILELSDYYSVDHRPSDETGGVMFFSKEWGDVEEFTCKDGSTVKATQWELFDNLMASIMQDYLEIGLVEYERVNWNQRQLDLIVPEIIQSFLEVEIKEAFDEAGEETEVIIRPDTLWQSFCEKVVNKENAELYLKKCTRRQLGRWLTAYLKACKYKTIKMVKKINGKAERIYIIALPEEARSGK